MDAEQMAVVAGKERDSELARGVLTGVACGIGAGALWGLVFLAPELVHDFSAVHVTVGRYLAYGMVSMVLIAPRWRNVTSRLTRREWWALAWLAYGGNGLYYVLLSTAVHYGGVPLTALMNGCLPVLVTLVGTRDRAAVPLRRLIPSLLLCLAGFVCIGWQALTLPAPGAAAHEAVAILCALGAVACWTSYAVINSRCLARLDPAVVGDWTLLLGLMTGTMAVVQLPLLLADPVRHAGADWLRLACVSTGLTLVASLAANSLWNRMSRLVPLTLTGQMIVFESLFGLLYGLLWEVRLPTPMEVAALVLILLGVFSCIAVHREPVPAT